MALNLCKSKQKYLIMHQNEKNIFKNFPVVIASKLLLVLTTLIYFA